MIWKGTLIIIFCERRKNIYYFQGLYRNFILTSKFGKIQLNELRKVVEERQDVLLSVLVIQPDLEGNARYRIGREV